MSNRNKRPAVGLRRLPSQRRRKFRARLMKKFDGKCVYCGTSHNLTIDHVIPTSRGGTNSFDNFVLACDECNKRKGNNIEWVESPK